MNERRFSVRKGLAGLFLMVAVVFMSSCASSGTGGAGGAGADSFHSPTTGFTIVKPGDWVFLSAETVAENRANIRLKDKELEEFVRERANMPLVVIARHQEPYDSLNPSVQVLFRPMGEASKMPPADILKATIKVLEGAFGDFTLLDGVKEVEVDGLKGAFFKAGYTVAAPDGREFKTLSSMWLILRGQFAFMISASGPPEGADFSDKEFARILKSVKIEK